MGPIYYDQGVLLFSQFLRNFSDPRGHYFMSEFFKVTQSYRIPRLSSSANPLRQSLAHLWRSTERCLLTFHILGMIINNIFLFLTKKMKALNIALSSIKYQLQMGFLIIYYNERERKQNFSEKMKTISRILITIPIIKKMFKNLWEKQIHFL